MSKWEREIENVLRCGMKYCFEPTVTGKYPQLLEDEFLGDKDSAGFLDLILSSIRDEIRRAFFDGYSLGASDVATELKLEFDSDLNKQGAWKGWTAREKERND